MEPVIVIAVLVGGATLGWGLAKFLRRDVWVETEQQHPLVVLTKQVNSRPPMWTSIYRAPKTFDEEIADFLDSLDEGVSLKEAAELVRQGKWQPSVENCDERTRPSLDR